MNILLSVDFLSAVLIMDIVVSVSTLQMSLNSGVIKKFVVIIPTEFTNCHYLSSCQIFPFVVAGIIFPVGSYLSMNWSCNGSVTLSC